MGQRACVVEARFNRCPECGRSLPQTWRYLGFRYVETCAVSESSTLVYLRTYVGVDCGEPQKADVGGMLTQVLVTFSR